MTNLNKFEKKLSFKENHRTSSQALTKKGNPLDLNGKIFVAPSGELHDLENVNIVGSWVDTVRQLYNGVLDEGFIHYLETSFEAGEVIELKNYLGFAAAGIEWHVQKMGKASGYRYKLQNSEKGFILLIGSFYCKPDVAGSHLKIEVSPHVLLRTAPKDVQGIMNHLAATILHQPEPAGVCLHLAADLQGWKPAFDHLENFVTYARFTRNYLGLQTAEIGEGFSEVACTYGSGDAQTITIGKPTGLQTSVYNKTKQAKHVDKVDFYDDEWGVYSLGEYDKNGPDVYRVEYRFHHSVIREMYVDDATNFVDYEQASKIIKNLWQYAIQKNRLELYKGVIHPVWQMLYYDVNFTTGYPAWTAKRRKKTDVSAVAKNYDLFVGNLISLTARQTADVGFLMSQLKKLHFYDDWLRYQRVERKRGEGELREFLKKQLLLRRMLRHAA